MDACQTSLDVIAATTPGIPPQPVFPGFLPPNIPPRELREVRTIQRPGEEFLQPVIVVTITHSQPAPTVIVKRETTPSGRPPLIIFRGLKLPHKKPIIVDRRVNRMVPLEIVDQRESPDAMIGGMRMMNDAVLQTGGGVPINVASSMPPGTIFLSNGTMIPPQQQVMAGVIDDGLMVVPPAPSPSPYLRRKPPESFGPPENFASIPNSTSPPPQQPFYQPMPSPQPTGAAAEPADEARPRVRFAEQAQYREFQPDPSEYASDDAEDDEEPWMYPPARSSRSSRSRYPGDYSSGSSGYDDLYNGPRSAFSVPASFEPPILSMRSSNAADDFYPRARYRSGPGVV
ncbi:hypothetical protein BZG36_03895 [Bifiguratus adelaidae]|uniref:Uncharacterized protein n=1 Tax=Bifiguratus adelaidae TaxID=1938954 RepID=A0A261XXQ3_9FUNG|nr:hypothetical protein BZG36_03895 [Bifiguratus adelaidae]